MHCPHCGTETPSGQKFCRVCGLDLRLISQALAKQLSGGDDKALVMIDRDILHKVYQKVVWGIIAIFVGFTIFGLGRRLLPGLGVMAGVLLSMLGTMLIIRSVISTLRLDTSHSAELSKTQMLEQSKGAAPLPPEQMPDRAPSVTEPTTKLLEKERVKVGNNNELED
jgi:hypothetical protein